MASLDYHSFKAAGTTPRDTHWWSLSANLKYVLRQAPWQPYVTGGLGIYLPKTGSAEPGVNFGLGVGRAFRPSWTFEAGGAYHNVFAQDGDVSFSVLRVGLIRRMH